MSSLTTRWCSRHVCSFFVWIYLCVIWGCDESMFCRDMFVWHNVRTRWSLFNHVSRAATIWQKQFTSTFSYIECWLGDICWGSREWNESALHHRCWVTSSTFLFCVVIFKYTLTESHYFPQAGFSHVLTRPLFSFFSHFF